VPIKAAIPPAKTPSPILAKTPGCLLPSL